MSVPLAQMTARDAFNHQRAKVAAYSRECYPDDPKLVAAKAELARLRAAHQADLAVLRIVRAIEKAPSLTGAQRGEIVKAAMATGDR